MSVFELVFMFVLSTVDVRGDKEPEKKGDRKLCGTKGDS